MASAGALVRQIEKFLEDGDIEGAQRQLGEADPGDINDHQLRYLSTRILYSLSKLDPETTKIRVEEALSAGLDLSNEGRAWFRGILRESQRPDKQRQEERVSDVESRHKMPSLSHRAPVAQKKRGVLGTLFGRSEPPTSVNEVQQPSSRRIPGAKAPSPRQLPPSHAPTVDSLEIPSAPRVATFAAREELHSPNQADSRQRETALSTNALPSILDTWDTEAPEFDFSEAEDSLDSHQSAGQSLSSSLDGSEHRAPTQDELELDPVPHAHSSVERALSDSGLVVPPPPGVPRNLGFEPPHEKDDSTISRISEVAPTKQVSSVTPSPDSHGNLLRRSSPSALSGHFDSVRPEMRYSVLPGLKERVSEPPAALHNPLSHVEDLKEFGETEQAQEELRRITEGPLAVEHRVAATRQWLAWGQLNDAVKQGVKALDQAPNSPAVRLVFACAIVRHARMKGDAWLVENARKVLQGVSSGSPEREALLACCEVRLGAIEQGRHRAEGLLARYPKELDAWAALAEAAHAIGDQATESHALQRLEQLSPVSARYLENSWNSQSNYIHPSTQPGSISRPGILAAQQDFADLRSQSERAKSIRPSISSSSNQHLENDATAHRSLRPSAGISSSPSVVLQPLSDSVELNLLRGGGLRVVQNILETLNQKSSGLNLELNTKTVAHWAESASMLFHESSIFRYFAPFNQSLLSLSRLDAAISLIFDEEWSGYLNAAIRTGSQEQRLLFLIGSYVGESLRGSHAGTWQFATHALEHEVLAAGRRWKPFAMAAKRLESGEAYTLLSQLEGSLAHQGTRAWHYTVASSAPVQLPWTTGTWPMPAHVGNFGRALPQSVVGAFAARHGQPLDFSINSLDGINRYLDLIAADMGVEELRFDWARRTAILAGSYLGETLRQNIGGRWTYGSNEVRSADDYRLDLDGIGEIRPVSQVLKQLISSGHEASSNALSDYAKYIIRRAR